VKVISSSCNKIGKDKKESYIMELISRRRYATVWCYGNNVL